MSKEQEIIDKVDEVLKKVFARVVIQDPYYGMMRELQQDIYVYKNRASEAKRLQKKGNSIRQIAKKLGYKHPGSVSHILTNKPQ